MLIFLVLMELGHPNVDSWSRPPTEPSSTRVAVDILSLQPGGCAVAPTVTYKVYTTDSWGDGWEGTVLAFQQNGVTISTFTLSAGSSGGPADYTFQKSATVTIKVSVLGYYTNEVGFTIRNAAGSVVFQRNPGTSFYAGNILGTFCPECVNLNPSPF